MDYVDPLEQSTPFDQRTPAAIAADVASRFDGPCFMLAEPAAGPVIGVQWTGSWSDTEPVEEIEVQQELATGSTALVLTTRLSPGGTPELRTRMANLYASNIGVDGPPRERLARARDALEAPSSPCTLSIDGHTTAARAVADHAAVVIGCALPDRLVIVFLEGNPLPRPTTLTTLHTSAT